MKIHALRRGNSLFTGYVKIDCKTEGKARENFSWMIKLKGYLPEKVIAKRGTIIFVQAQDAILVRANSFDALVSRVVMREGWEDDVIDVLANAAIIFDAWRAQE